MTTKRKTLTLIIVGILIVAVVAFGVVQALQPKTTAVQTAVLAAQSLVRTIVIDGSLEAADSYETTLNLSQKVIKVVHPAGDTVAAGDVLLQLDTADLEYQLDKAVLNRDLLKLSVANARKQARISLQIAQINYNQARKNYSDALDKYDDDLISKLARDQAYSARQTALNQLELAQSQYDNLNLKSAQSEQKKQIDAASLDIANLKRKISESTIVSPIAGKVTVLDARENQLPAAGANFVQVVDLSGLKITSLVNQYDVVQLVPGQKVSLQIKGLAATFSGSITTIADVETQASSAVSSEPKYELTISLDWPDGAADGAANDPASRLKPGYEAKATVTTQEKPGAVAVGLADIRRENDQAFVFVVEAGKAVKKPVTTGLETTDQIEIVEGLAAGITYIISPPAELADGDLVEPQAAD